MAAYYLVLAAALSSLVGSVAGIGGGILLLSFLSFLVPANSIVPLHATVQSVSCFSRVFVFKKYIDWTVVLPFYLGMIPGTILAVFLARYIFSVNQNILLIFISFYIIFSIFSQNRNIKIPSADIRLVGFVCGVLGIFVGSTGPVVSTWLLNENIIKENHIGTKSAMQLLAHLVKLPAFVLFLDFEFSQYLQILFLMCPVAIFCTFIGKRVLLCVNDKIFNLVVRLILFVLAFNILINEIPKVI